MKKIIIFCFLSLILILNVSIVYALDILQPINFIDVPEDSWYTNSLDRLSESSIIYGYDDNTFRPNNNITRAEVAVMLDRTSEILQVDRDFAIQGVYDRIQSVNNKINALNNPPGECFHDNKWYQVNEEVKNSYDSNPILPGICTCLEGGYFACTSEWDF